MIIGDYIFIEDKPKKKKTAICTGCGKKIKGRICSIKNAKCFGCKQKRNRKRVDNSLDVKKIDL